MKRSKLPRKPLKAKKGTLKGKKRSKGILRASRGKIKPSQLRTLKKKLEAAQKAVVIKLYGTDCYTCHQTDLKGSNAHLGHVPWPRAILSQECIYDIRFTRIQCFSCNIHRGGMGAVALQKMKDEGINTDAMWKLNESMKGKPVPTIWYKEKLSDYELILAPKVFKEMSDAQIQANYMQEHRYNY